MGTSPHKFDAYDGHRTKNRGNPHPQQVGQNGDADRMTEHFQSEIGFDEPSKSDEQEHQNKQGLCGQSQPESTAYVIEVDTQRG